MANTNSKSPISVHIETTFTDGNGQEVYTAHYREQLERDPNTGEIVSLKHGENTTLSSGESFNPSMASGLKPVLPVGTCHFCNSLRKKSARLRTRNVNPLCSLKRLKHCHRCGRPGCPLHMRHSKRDGRWRCLKHHRLHQFGDLLSKIFYKLEES